MIESPLQSEIDAAQAYETLMLPALFGQWAPRIVAAARVRAGQHVLDLACGTGVVAREAVARTEASGFVAALDPNPGMLEVARRVTPKIEWHQGHAESLPFSDRAFDAVVCQFGLMFFTDRRAALREALRVLAPGGRLVFAVWSALDNMPAFAIEVALLESIAGARAADAVRAPFVLGNRNRLVELFAAAGVTSLEVVTVAGTARFPGIRAMVEADLRGWLPIMGVNLPEQQIAEILDEAEHVLRPYVEPDGAIAFATSAHIVTGTRA